MQIMLYKFSKRPNSTMQPEPGSAQKTLECYIKDECSFLSPVLRFNTGVLTSGTFSPSAYNYAMIPYWQRYYYIMDWQWVNGAWEAYLKVDPMASFKTEIGNTSAYVVRCADANHFDGNIIDTFYPTTVQTLLSHISFNPPWYNRIIQNGCFVVGIINNDATTYRMGSVVYYAMYNTEFKTLMQYLFSSNIYNNSNITEIGEGLYKSLFNPFQYIVSVMWVPWIPTELSPTSDIEINIGYWNTGCTGKVVHNFVLEGGFTSEQIPVHPQITRGEYLNREPFTRVTAYIPPFGEIPIDTMFFTQDNNNNHLYCHYEFDVVTGICEAYFSITNGQDPPLEKDAYNIITMRTAQLGIPIQISQIMSDYMSALSNASGAISNAFSFNIAGIFENLGSAVEAVMPKVSSLGSNGSLINLAEKGFIVVEHYRQSGVNRAEFGRPYCQTITIKSLSGYIKCGEADHAFTATKTETEEINMNLRNGFFYE